MSETKYKTLSQLVDEDRSYVAVTDCTAEGRSEFRANYGEKTFPTFEAARHWLRLQEVGGTIYWRDADGRHERRVGPSFSGGDSIRGLW
jgi:hypothetical protein